MIIPKILILYNIANILTYVGWNAIRRTGSWSMFSDFVIR